MEAGQDLARSITKRANLRDLALDDWQESTTMEQFLSVFTRCPSLKTLRLKQPSAPAGVDGTDIGRICPDLRDISYDGSSVMDGNDKWPLEVMETLRENQMESLEYQSASHCRLDDATAVKTLLRHSSSLWQIKIISPVTSSAVRMILETCKALEVLQISRSTVELCDAIASPWACSKMTSLTLSIKISPSSSPPGTEFVPSYLQEPPTPLSAGEKNIFTQLEVFYRQIGKLTGLRHLNIDRTEYSEHGSIVGRSNLRDRPLPGMLILSTNRAGRPGFLDLLGGLSKLETVEGAIFPETADRMMSEFTREFTWIFQLSPYFRFDNASPSLEALTRNLRHIRQLETTDPTLVHLLAFHPAALNQLQSLDLYLYDDKTSFFPTTDSPEPGMALGNNIQAIRRILEGCHNLQVLSLGITDCFKKADKTVAFQEIMSACPTESLESIKLYFETQDPGFYQQQHLPSFIALQDVFIRASTNHMHSSTLAFLVRCPNLVRLEMDSVDDCVLFDLADTLQAFCPNLVELVWTDNNYEDEYTAAVLGSSRLGWRVLTTPWHVGFGPLTYEAVMRSAETLEELKMSAWGSSSSEVRWRFYLDMLCSARNLRKLTGLDGQTRSMHESTIEVHAEKAFKQHIESSGGRTWVLGPLMKYLGMQVIGVPRPDVVCRDNGTPLRSWMVDELDDSRRYEVQRWIYEQLGRMTGLEELVLGVVDICLEDVGDYMPEEDVNDEGISLTELEDEMEEDDWLNRLINYQSLEFSLESGLELLSGLKVLELLDVKSTAHRIGVEELEWMHVHWPKLKEIKGLVTERKWAGDGEEGIKVKQDVEAWIAAHPHGIGSSYY
ncbi:hypothetical protein BGZ90_007121 [Linnemannia elongata]|nr:hypothetical protein BGZ90_007121 [Linnemannia elongata]